jgi:hypothetical protein
VTVQLPELRGVDLSQVRSRGQFAVAETLGQGIRVLCLTDDVAEATELAAELRKRGVRAAAFRT